MIYSEAIKLPADRRVIRSIRQAAIIVAMFFVMSIGAGVAFSQPQSPERGVNNNKSYAVSQIETISTQSGNVMLNVPLASLPAGRGGMSASLSLGYTSKLWDNETMGSGGYYQDQLMPNIDGGWRYRYSYHLALDWKKGQECQSGKGADNHIFKLNMVLPDGSKHPLFLGNYANPNADGWLEFLPDGKPGCTTYNGPFVYYSTDGTFLRLEYTPDADSNFENNPWTLYLSDGSKVVNYGTSVPPATNITQRIYDRNNNFIEIVENASDANFFNHRTTYIRDQLDRKIVVEYAASANEDWVRATGFNGTSLITKILWKSIGVNKTYNGCNTLQWQSGCGSLSLNTTLTMVDKIKLPALLGDPYSDSDFYYLFDYNGGTGWAS